MKCEDCEAVLKHEHEYRAKKCNKCIAKSQGKNPEYDWDRTDIPVQKWIIAWKNGRRWETVHLPGCVSEEVVDQVMTELNKHSDIIWSRIKEGCLEWNNHYTRKDDFIGVSL